MKIPLIKKCVGVLLLCAAMPSMAQQAIQINVKAPVTRYRDTLFIAGNFNGWDPHKDPLQFREADSSWNIDLINNQPGTYEFKFTRGSWDKAETAASGAGIQNRVLHLNKDTAVSYAVEAWSDDFAKLPPQHTASSQVSVIDTAFFIPQLNRHRRIWIYLPAGYAGSREKYPVIYMQDGQNLFDSYTAPYGEWAVDECLDSLADKNQPEAIVVGIDNGPERLQEYNPYDNERFGKGEGKLYVDFLINTLKPFIDRKYRTLTGPAYTAIAGSSMGGLIAYYAALEHPGVFGKAGVFSPAFWTAPGIRDATDSLASAMKAKLFFYMGGQEGDDYVDDMKAIAEKIGTRSGSLVYTVIDEEGRHNEAAWRKWFPAFYTWIMADWTNSVININD